jgi:general secretion pathway protein B
MSYILEALKKAEAERRQEKVPGIHTQPLPAPSAAHRESSWQRTPVWIAAICVAAAALLAAMWFKPWQSQPVPVQVAQAPIPAAATAPPVQTALPAPAPAPTTVRSQNENPRVADALPQPPQHREQKAHEKEKPAAVSAPAAVEARVPSLRELPEQIQREIPEFKVGGYIYADKPADRSVLINNRLLHEGDEAAPGVTLERMQKNGMILRYKEFRFRRSY